MKTDFLVRRAKKSTSGSKAPAKAVGNQAAPLPSPGPATDAMIVSDMTPLSLQVTPVDVEPREVEREIPTETGRVDKRPRCESSSDPAPAATIRTAAFVAPVPSMADMRKLAPSNDVCLKEKAWLKSLCPQVLQLEGMKYMEMARLSMLTSTSYCNLLDGKCKGIREENEARKKLDAVSKQIEEVTADLAKANGNAITLEGEKAMLEEENASLAEEKAKLEEVNTGLEDERAAIAKENALLKADAEKHQSAMNQKDRETSELRKQRADFYLESQMWRGRAEQAVIF